MYVVCEKYTLCATHTLSHGMSFYQSSLVSLYPQYTYRNTMVKTIEEVKERVSAIVGAATLKRMMAFVEAEKPSLWGTTKRSGFVGDAMILTIYKDVKNVGYKHLRKNLVLGYPLNHKSLQYNTQTIKRSLGRWGKSTIQLGEKREWTSAATGAQIPKVLQKKGWQAYL